MNTNDGLGLYRSQTRTNAHRARERERAGRSAEMGEQIPMAANAHQLRLMFLEACHTGEMYDFGCAAKDFTRIYSPEDMADALAPVCRILSDEDLWSLLQALDIEEYLTEEDEEDVEDEPTVELEILETPPEPEILDNVHQFPAATGNG